MAGQFFKGLVKLGRPLLEGISGVAAGSSGGDQKTAGSAEAQREANSIASRQNDITSQRDDREGDRADRATQHQINQDTRQNGIDDEQRKRQNRFEDEDRQVLNKQRQRDETKLQTSDDNDFIIRADFVKKAGDVLRRITFGEYNITIASGITKDRWEVEPEGEVLSEVIGVRLTDGSDVKFEVRVFQSGTLIRNGSMERDAFYIWPKPLKKKKAPPTKGVPAAGTPQVAGPIRATLTRIGALAAPKPATSIIGGIVGLLGEAKLAEANKQLEEEQAKQNPIQGLADLLAKTLKEIRTFEFEELEQTHTEKQMVKKLNKHKDAIDQQLQEMRGGKGSVDEVEDGEDLEDAEEEDQEEPLPGKRKSKGGKGARGARQPSGEAEEEDLDEAEAEDDEEIQ